MYPLATCHLPLATALYTIDSARISQQFNQPAQPEQIAVLINKQRDEKTTKKQLSAAAGERSA